MAYEEHLIMYTSLEDSLSRDCSFFYRLLFISYASFCTNSSWGSKWSNVHKSERVVIVLLFDKPLKGFIFTVGIVGFCIEIVYECLGL